MANFFDQADPGYGIKPKVNVTPEDQRVNTFEKPENFFDQADPGYEFRQLPPGTLPRGGPIIHEPSKLPGLGAQALGSMPTDLQTRMQYLAQQIFPDMNPTEALGRMGVDTVEGIYYIGEDGKKYAAEPKFNPIDEPLNTLRQLPDIAASGLGPSMGTIGGITGGLAFSGTGGGIPGAMGGGAAADIARQGIAALATGEDKPIIQRGIQTGGVAAEQGVGQLLGLGLAKGIGKLVGERNPLRIAGYDFGGLTEPRIKDIQAAAEKAKKMGVTVTPGEAGDIRSLLIRQRQMARQPEGATKLADFYSQRNIQQLPAAWQKVMGEISPTAAPGVGARNLQKGATEAIEASRAERKIAAEPIYKEAFRLNQTVQTKELDRILTTPAGKQALRDVAKDMQNDRSLLGVSDKELTELKNELVKLGKMADPKSKGVAAGLKLQTYDLIKQKLWDIAKENRGKYGEPTFSSRAIDNLRVSLTKELDKVDQSGLYAQARKTYEIHSPPVTELQEGLVGLAAKDRAAGWQNAPRTMFGATSADSLSISQARKAFEKAGRMDEWNAGLRSFLQESFENAAKQEKGPAGNLWKTLKGSAAQNANLKAAMTPTQYSALDNFMQVAEMVKRAPFEGSPTATDLSGRAAFATGPAKFFGNIVSPLNIPATIRDWIIDASAGTNVGKLVDVITNPDAVQSLSRLRMLKPGTRKFIQEIGYLTSVLGFEKTTDFSGARVQTNQLPAIMGGQ